MVWNCVSSLHNPAAQAVDAPLYLLVNNAVWVTRWILPGHCFLYRRDFLTDNLEVPKTLHHPQVSTLPHVAWLLLVHRSPWCWNAESKHHPRCVCLAILSSSLSASHTSAPCPPSKCGSLAQRCACLWAGFLPWHWCVPSAHSSELSTNRCILWVCRRSHTHFHMFMDTFK